MTQTAIVIPALNEARTIAAVLVSAKQLAVDEIIVVDDGSDDDTARIARRQGVTVLSHVSSRSAWLAMQTGMRYAVKRGYTRVLTMDADGQHTAESAQTLLNTSVKQDALLIGSCPARGSRLRHTAWWMFRRLTGLKVGDITSGLRLYSGKALHAAVSRQASMLEYQDVGVLLLMSHLALDIREVQVPMRERVGDKSRIFSSWGKVIYYMITTLLLCAAKAFPQKSAKLEKRLTHAD